MPENNTGGLNYRAAYIDTENGAPKSLDVENRSVGVIGTTEDPARVFDWERMEIIDEVLLMSGVKLPKTRKLPLLDSHNRNETRAVLGSFKNIITEKDMLTGRVFFSKADEAESPWIKVQENHLDSFSVGYRTLKSVVIDEGETKTIEGKKYSGPLTVRTKWEPAELSILAIGADRRAKTRADINQKTGGNKMDEKLRKFLESKGLDSEATDKEAWEFLQKLDVPNTEEKKPVWDLAESNEKVNRQEVKTEDVETIKKLAAAEERIRNIEIRNMCADLKMESEADELISKGYTVDQAREVLFPKLKAMLDNEAKHLGPAVIEKDERDKFKAAAEDAILIRAGSVSTPEKPAPGAEDLAGYSLKELARLSLQRANMPTGGRTLDMVGRALNLKATTTGDLPYVLANVANKSLFEGFDNNQETWNIWCGTGSVPDFKTNYIPRLGEADDLEEIPENSQYQYGSAAEAQESFSIATYGKIWPISRQAIINDDLNALTQIPMLHGEAASRKIGDIAYAVLTANAAMGDGVALFATAHGNYVAAGSGAAPGEATITAGVLAMGTQKDLKGLRRLNIRPMYYIGPKALEGTAEIFFSSQTFSDHSTVATDSTFASTRTNIYYGTYLTRVHEPRLDDTDAAAWYLAGMKGKTVNVYFLDGQQRPYLESQVGWTVDGTEYKVRLDAGAKAVSYRALYFNDGN